MDQQETRSVPVTWIGLEDTPIQFANQFLSQFQGNELILTIGVLTPPMILGSEEEKRRQLENITYVPIQPVSRVAMTIDRARELLQVLQDNLARHDAVSGTEEHPS